MTRSQEVAVTINSMVAMAGIRLISPMMSATIPSPSLVMSGQLQTPR